MKHAVRWCTIFVVVVGMLCAGTLSFAQDMPKFKIMTEPWSPWQVENNGKVEGVAVDLLVLMLERVGSAQGRGDIKMYPWARGYDEVQKNENTILFSMTRTEERENMFKWVGPIFQNTSHLIAKKDKNITIASADDVKKYKVGTVLDDVGEQYMEKMGIAKDKLQRAKSGEINAKKLNAGRIDLVVSSWSGFEGNCKDAGVDPSLFAPVYAVHSADISYAFYKGTSNAIIGAFQKALDELKAEGKLDELSAKYK